MVNGTRGSLNRGVDDEATGVSEGSWKDRWRSGLAKSAARLSAGLSRSFGRPLDEEVLQALEDSLIEADLGVTTASLLVSELAKQHRGAVVDSATLRGFLATLIAEKLRPAARPLNEDFGLQPIVVLMIGVNGSGKTTSIGKLAWRYTQQGRKVMMAAGDTFRAAAVEQLCLWAERTQSEIVTGPAGADAAGLAHDACLRACAQGMDMLLIDTAGRLHTKNDLMAELDKINRSVAKAIPGAPHATLLVLDAGAGQNVLSQIENFQAIVTIDGLIMTKLDGSARGGILVAVTSRFGLPITAVGVGEGVDDLEDFSPDLFAKALVGVA